MRCKIVSKYDDNDNDDDNVNDDDNDDDDDDDDDDESDYGVVANGVGGDVMTAGLLCG